MNDNHYSRQIRSYVIGFVVSLCLTIAAYAVVVGHLLIGTTLIVIVAGFALVQMIVQLIFFLHLGSEDRPRWRLLLFGLMMAILAIIVIGSVWIMYHLNYNMMDMSGSDKDAHMMEQRDKGF